MGMCNVDISVVIPCFRDDAALGRLLSQLRAGASQPHEIVVVDAEDGAATHSLCQRWGARRLPSRPCRGAQLRQGAFAATGDVIWFLHADATLQGDPLGSITQAMGRGAAGGYFRFRFAGACRWQARVLERLINLRCRIGIPYGDQGLFMTVAAYVMAGGHSVSPLFEEVALVRKLRQQGPFVVIDDGLRVDPRRWERDGWWRRSFRNRILALAFAAGLSPNVLARGYGNGETGT